MKKRTLILSTLSLMLAFSLASCAEAEVELPSISIEGVDASINNTSEEIKFSVGHNEKMFDLTKIKVEGANIRVLDKDGKEIPGSVSLKVGSNEFTLVVTTSKAEVRYKLIITREAPSALEVKSISVKTLSNAYAAGEEFKPGRLLVTYTDDSVSEIDLTLSMVEGFTTDSLGKKTLTISYEGKSVAYEIEVFERLYELVDVKSVYALGEEFSGGRIKLSVGSNISYVDITPDMVVGFDSATLGTKTLKVNYDGKELTLEYTVAEVVVEVKEFKKSYLKDSEFVPGILHVTFGSSEEDIEITSDMVVGFDTSKLGELDIVIKYQNFEIPVKINVFTPDGMQGHAIRSVFASINAYQQILYSTDSTNLKSQYDLIKAEVYNSITDTDLNEILPIIEEYNITNDQILAVAELLDNEGFNLVNLLVKSGVLTSGIWENLFAIVEKRDIENLKSLFTKVSDIIPAESIASLIPYINATLPTLPFIKDMEVINLPLDEIIKLSGIDELINQINLYIGAIDLTASDKVLIGRCINSVLKSIGSLDTDIVYNFIKALNIKPLDDLTEEEALKYQNEAALKLIHTASEVVEDLYNKLDKDLMNDLLNALFNHLPAMELEMVYDREDLKNLVVEALRYAPDLFSFLKTCTIEEIQDVLVIYTGISSNTLGDNEFRALQRLAKRFKPVFIKILDDSNLIKAANNLSTRYGVKRVDFLGIVNYLVEFADLPLLDKVYTPEEISKLMNLALIKLTLHSDFKISFNNDILLKKGSKANEILPLLQSCYVFSGVNAEGNIITFNITEDNILNLSEIEADLNIVGLHKILLSINDINVEIPYYVYESEDLIPFIDVYEECYYATILYDSESKDILGLSLPDGRMLDKSVLDNMFKGLRLNLYISEINYAMDYVLDSYTYEFIIGQNDLSALKVISSEGTLYLLFKANAVDLNNLRVTDVHVNYDFGSNEISKNDTTSTIYLTINSSFKLEYSISDFEFDRTASEALLGIDLFSKRVEFSLVLIDDVDAKLPSKIVSSKFNIYDKDFNNVFFHNENRIEVLLKGNIMMVYSGSELKELFDSYNVDTYKLERINSLNKPMYNLSCLNGSSEVFSFTFIGEPMSDEEYNSFAIIKHNIDDLRIGLSAKEFRDVLEYDYYDFLNERLLSSFENYTVSIEGFNQRVDNINLAKAIKENGYSIENVFLNQNDDYVASMCVIINGTTKIEYQIFDMENSNDQIDVLSIHKKNNKYKLSDISDYTNIDIDIIKGLIAKEFTFDVAINGLIKTISGNDFISLMDKNGAIFDSYIKDDFNINILVYIPKTNFNLELSVFAIPVDLMKVEFICNEVVYDINRVSNDELLDAINSTLITVNLTGLNGLMNDVYAKDYIKNINILARKEDEANCYFDVSTTVLGVELKSTLAIRKCAKLSDLPSLRCINDYIAINDVNNITFDEIKHQLVAIYKDFIFGMDYDLYKNIKLEYNVYNENSLYLRISALDSNGEEINELFEEIVGYMSQDSYNDYRIKTKNIDYKYDGELIYLEDNSLDGIKRELDTLSYIEFFTRVGDSFGDIDISIEEFKNLYKMSVADLTNGEFKVSFEGPKTFNIKLKTTNDPNQLVDFEVRETNPLKSLTKDGVIDAITSAVFETAADGRNFIEDKQRIKDYLNDATMEIKEQTREYIVYVKKGSFNEMISFEKPREKQYQIVNITFKSDIVIPDELNEETFMTLINNVDIYQNGNITSLTGLFAEELFSNYNLVFTSNRFALINCYDGVEISGLIK